MSDYDDMDDLNDSSFWESFDNFSESQVDSKKEIYIASWASFLFYGLILFLYITIKPFYDGLFQIFNLTLFLLPLWIFLYRLKDIYPKVLKLKIYFYLFCSFIIFQIPLLQDSSNFEKTITSNNGKILGIIPVGSLSLIFAFSIIWVWAFELRNYIRKRKETTNEEDFDSLNEDFEEEEDNKPLRDFVMNLMIAKGFTGVKIKSGSEALTEWPTTLNIELDVPIQIKVESLKKDVLPSIERKLKTIGYGDSMIKSFDGRVFIMANKKKADIVDFDEVVEENAHKISKDYNIILGITPMNQPIIESLESMVHILFAGTTGSGKTQTVHSILNQLIMNYTPDELQLGLIDPKVTGFGVYEGLPHLLSPIILGGLDEDGNDIDIGERIKNLLLKLRKIYGYRLKVLREFWQFDIYKFNKDIPKMKQKLKSDYEQKIKNTEDREKKIDLKEEFKDKLNRLKKIPVIFIVIDELADVMLDKKNNAKVSPILSQLAGTVRATGIVFMVGTQKPSAEVYPTLLKANMPTAICLKVASWRDSQQVINQSGGEKLGKYGDGLLLPNGTEQTIRFKSPYITSEQVIANINSLKEEYWERKFSEKEIKEIIEGLEENSANNDNSRDKKDVGDVVPIVESELFDIDSGLENLSGKYEKLKDRSIASNVWFKDSAIRVLSYMFNHDGELHSTAKIRNDYPKAENKGINYFKKILIEAEIIKQAFNDKGKPIANVYWLNDSEYPDIQSIVIGIHEFLSNYDTTKRKFK